MEQWSRSHLGEQICKQPLIKQALLSVFITAIPVITFAESVLRPHEPQPAPTDSSFSVLGVTPGDTLDAATGILSGHFDADLAPDVIALAVRSSEGRELKYAYAQRLISPWVTPFVRLGSEPYEDVNVSLATGVLEGRVLGIDRVIVATGSQRSSAESVFMQVEGAFGTPSLVHLDAYKSELIYAYADGAFIADLHAVDPTPSNASVGSSDYLSDGTPCKTAIGRSSIYQYRSPRGDDWIGNCDLVFRIVVESGGAKTTIRFSLNDYALTRVNRDETDSPLSVQSARQSPKFLGCVVERQQFQEKQIQRQLCFQPAYFLSSDAQIVSATFVDADAHLAPIEEIPKLQWELRSPQSLNQDGFGRI